MAASSANALPLAYAAALSSHDARVTRVSAAVSRFSQAGVQFRLYHGTTNSTRPSSRFKHATLDVSDLSHVLHIDTQSGTCVCEPNVPMDALVAAVQRESRGRWIPPVVPEFPGITVGGSFAGTAGESSSFRHGFFDNTVNWAKVVLADGKVIKATSSPDDPNSDLFHGCKGTFGTIGIGVLFELRLVPARKYVELSYHIVSKGIEEAKEILLRECMKPPTLPFEGSKSAGIEEEKGAEIGGTADFVDGIMFSKTWGVIMSGKFTDSNEDGLDVVTFDQPWDQWFYLHAEESVTKHQLEMKRSRSRQSSTKQSAVEDEGEVYRDLVPLSPYLFRYDRGAFWTGRYAYSYFLTPFTRLTRYMLDHFMHTRVMYHALHRSGLMSQFIIQDMALPWRKVDEFYDWIDEKYNIYPQWLCPLRTDTAGGGLNPHKREDEREAAPFLLNLGVWGPLPIAKSPFLSSPVLSSVSSSIPWNSASSSTSTSGAGQTTTLENDKTGDEDTNDDVQLSPRLRINRSIEYKLARLGGMKWLYAQTFYTRSEFWSIYDERPYRELRRKYRAEGKMIDVYDKVGGGRAVGFLNDVTAQQQQRNPEEGKTDELSGLWATWPLAGLYGVLSTLKGGDYLRKK